MYFTYQNGTSDSIVKYPGNSTSPTGTTTAAFPSFTNSVQIAHAKIDAAGYVYVDQNGNTSQISRQNITNGANYTSGTWPINNTTTGCTSLSDPEEMAVTRTGDAIFAGYGNGSGTSLFYITAGGACTQLANSSLNAGFNAPFGVAIDGNDYAFITNRGTTSISEVDTSAGTAAGTVAISPSGGYSPQTTGNATILANPLNIAIDPSGNVWTTNYAGNAIVEIVGLAAPTTEPLSAAAIPLSYTQGSIGYKP
jgi:streptogramin lyase